MKTLISTTNFVLEQFDLLYKGVINQDEYVTRTKKFADFIKQPLTLGMFVPCDENGNILEEPEQFKDWIKSDHYFNASES